jgi:hypothetical protein
MAELAGVYRWAIAITPSDTQLLSRPCDALWVVGATSGQLTIVDHAGNTTTIPGLTNTQGMLVPIGAKKIMATGTTVSGVLALYL